MAIVKSEGVTRTEKLLASLCDRSFLRLWSYPNPFKEDKDELCDLLAVFENHVFIFFDRENLQLTDTEKDPLVLWNRWKRNVIDDQLRTANGAEKYIKSGRPIFLDAASTQLFPIEFDPKTAKIHKVIVAHGASEACKAASDQNIYGSLAISYGSGDSKANMPFMIDINRENPVHVFDSHNLAIIFDELDTFHDLVSYFEEKTEAISKFSLQYCGEEDLIAHYFYNIDSDNKKHFIGPRTNEENFDCVLIGEGEWRDFIKLEQYKNKKLEDKESYFWDHLIQKTCDNALKGTLGGNADLLNGKSAVRVMAKEPRVMRRIISSRMLHVIRDFSEAEKYMRRLNLFQSYFAGTGYVFLQLMPPDRMNYEKYREIRRAIIEIACGAAKNKWPELTTIVGIAMEPPKFAETISEDFILLECNDWSPEMVAYYEEANRELQCFASPSLTRHEFRTHEFPLSRRNEFRPKNTKVGRNDPCPCGSGLKYKRCCIM